MTNRDILAASVERSVKVAGSGAQQDLLGLLGIFKDKLLEQLRGADVPGVMASTFIMRGDDMVGPGMALALQDRLILGWQKGLFRKSVLTVLPMSSITRVESGGKPKKLGTKPLAPLRVIGNEPWELLFTQDAPDLALRDTLSELLSGSLTMDQLPEGARRS